MAELSILWETVTGTGDSDTSGHDDGQMFQLLRSLFSRTANLGGVSPDFQNELAVTGTATPVSVNTGAALVYGIPYFNSAAVTVAIATPASLTRIDRIVLRASWAAKTVRITRIAGTEGGAAPAMVQTAGTTWDIPLATVSITTGAVITVTDAREWVGQIGDYAVLAGTAGGQSLSGGTAANEDLTLQGTTHATKATSYVLAQTTGGHIGLGTTDMETWDSGYVGVQMGATSALMAGKTVQGLYLADGAYYDGAWKRKNATVAPSRISMTGGLLYLDVASTGAADSAITWVNALTISNTGSMTLTAITAKTTPIDADSIALIDSAAANVLKKVTFADFRTAIGPRMMVISLTGDSLFASSPATTWSARVYFNASLLPSTATVKMVAYMSIVNSTDADIFIDHADLDGSNNATLAGTTVAIENLDNATTVSGNLKANMPAGLKLYTFKLSLNASGGSTVQNAHFLVEW